MEKINVEEIFASRVFTRSTMRERLPGEVYREVLRVMDKGGELSPAAADVVAKAMKDWAVENGATHYTHWFQPLTGITAEKHDSFVSHPDVSGKMIMDFSGRELIKGEPDASSFPSGGLRATFEARGYTAWDITSPAFLKEDATGVILCIPTAFCSYNGEALDKKTPLLRSAEALSRQALRALRLFGNQEVQKVIPTLGAEQEYFLIDRELFERRQDLVLCGRTLFGARPPKGQEMEDHYYGSIKPRVSAFMKELDEQLWRLGIYAKTEHNEVAPAQHELAPAFTDVNTAVDHNQLTMEMMKTVAQRHGLACILHEKPFAGVNGSGKHNNWSLASDAGVNLLEPGDSPEQNAQFLLFLTAVICAVDEYADLLRVAVATAGNDCRLGGAEAPPPIVSMFLGDEITAILESIMEESEYVRRDRMEIKVGVHALPPIPKDATDRNRTSPFAFTGNKFEFRMPGSAVSLSGPNFILNTIVAEQLRRFADRLEGAEDFNGALQSLLRQALKEHKRIIFNGNNYAEEWEQEAARRGLPNLKTAVDALRCFTAPKNIQLFARHGVLTEEEIRSRTEIMLDSYCKTLRIEALTMIDMCRKQIMPAASRYGADLCRAALDKRSLSPEIDAGYETELCARLSSMNALLGRRVEQLERELLGVKDQETALACGEYYRDVIFVSMQEVRALADGLEAVVAEEYWPYPAYARLLFGV